MAPAPPPPTPPVVRNLSSTYLRFRHKQKESRGRLGGLFGSEGQNLHLLGGGVDSKGEVAIEMSSQLPPQWVESSEEAQEDLKNIRAKLVQLTKVQQKRLLKIFGDDPTPEKEVEAICSQVSTLVRRCEQQIHQVKQRGAGAGQSASEVEFRQNVQRNLATQLQKLSQQFRQSQKDYLREIQKRQLGGQLEDGSSGIGGGGGGGGAAQSAADRGFDDSQMLELEQMETNAGQRSQEICAIASSITDLHTIFKELAVLVIDQGSILDRIDYNIEQVVDQSREANVQLQKAAQSQKSNRALKCILLLVFMNAVLILILILKARH